MKILQRISHVFKFATPKAAKVKEDPTPIVKPRTLIINDNLRFDAKKFVMFMLPYYSKILTNGPTYLEMDTTSSVLELSFVDKAKNDVEQSSAWSQRKTFEFTFKQLHLLLDVEIGSNISVLVEHSDKQRQNVRYLITDASEKKEVEFEYQQLLNQTIKKKTIFSLDYSEYSIFQDLLRESVYDLSGLPLSYDIKKQDVLDIVKKEIRQSLSKQTQMETYYPSG